MAGDRIVFVGHATVLLELDGVRLLTDPLLRARVAHLRRFSPPAGISPPAGVSVEDLVCTGADAVLISHLHRDHLDLPSLRLLGRATPLLVPTGAGAWLHKRGFANVSELSVGAATAVGPSGARTAVGQLTVTAVKARHDGARQPGGVRAQALGYLIQGSHTIYFAGDTGLFEEMRELAHPAPGRRVSADTTGRMDVALLPVSGWGTKLGPGHMGPEEAARAAALLAPRLAIPIHWGTLLPIGRVRARAPTLGDPPRLFARHAARLAPDVEVKVLQPGEALMLGPLAPIP